MVDFREWMDQDSEIVAHETSDGVELSLRVSGAKGSIYANKDADNPSIYRVTRVWAEPQGKGYGKRLYMAALDFVTKKGGMLAPAKNSTSDSAANVWRSLYRSGGVEKFPLRASDWTLSGRSKEMEAKYSGIRYSDPNTHPPKTDSEFWTFNSGYRLGRGVSQSQSKPVQQKAQNATQIQRRNFPPGTEDLELEKM